MQGDRSFSGSAAKGALLGLTAARLGSLLAPFVLALVGVWLWSKPVRAGERYTVSALTFGPGDHPFTKFGHNAILVEDHERRTQRVYNYGTFAFDSPWLIPEFLLGKYRYWLSVQTLSQTLENYRAHNRQVVLQKLALSPDSEQQLAEFLAWNALPQNKYYLYDYYLDNCSTRVRDAIDRATGGAVLAASQVPGEQSWRAHTQRLTADNLPVYFGLYIALAQRTDLPTTLWEETFLPVKLRQALNQARVLGPDGSELPLVKSERVLVESTRAPLRAGPPSWTGSFAATGVALGSVLAGFGWLGRGGRRLGRQVLGVSLGVLGLFFGTLGTVFLGLWLFTNHEAAYRNENLLQCAPVALALCALGPGVFCGGARTTERAARICLLLLALSALGLLLKVLPWFYQDNQQIIALLLPVWAGCALATRWLRDRVRSETRGTGQLSDSRA